MAQGEQYNINVKLSATDKNVSKILGDLTGKSTSFASKLKSGFAFGAIASAGAACFNSIRNGLSSITNELNTSSKAWKTFESNLRMFGRSDAEINSAKTALQDYATATIYSASDMASTYSQLDAVGTKSTTSLVKGMGNLAAMSENPTQAMKTLSQQMTQTAAKSTVAWQDFKLMMEQTPAGVAAVAKEMGMSANQLVLAIQDGTVSTEEFFSAISKIGENDAYLKLAMTYKTADQAMDGLKETLVTKLQPAYDKLQQVGVSALTAIIDKVQSIDFSFLVDGIDKFVSKSKQLWDTFKNTGAVDALSTAFSSLGTALGNVFDSLGSGKTDILNQIVLAFGNLVKMISEATISLSNFISGIDPGIMNGLLKTLAAAVVGFKSFNFLKSFNPFGIFSKNAEDAQMSISKSSKSSKSTITKVFNGIGTVITKVGNSITKITNSVGNQINKLAGKFVNLMKSANPVNLLAFSTIILAIGAAFTMMGSQGEGISTILQGLGTAFANLSPIITALGSAIVLIVEQLGTSISQIIESLTPIVQIIADAFVQVAPIVSQCIVQIVEALAPFLPVISEIVASVSSAVTAIANSFNTLLSNVVPILQQIESIINTVGTNICNIINSIVPVLNALNETFNTVFTGILNVVSSVGDAISGVLNSIANIIDSIGDAALNAGKGFNELSKGLERITNLNLFDMAASMAAVIAALGGVTALSGGLESAGSGMQSFSKGIQMVAVAGPVASQSLMALVSALTPISSLLPTIGPLLETAATAIQSFAISSMNSTAGIAALSSVMMIAISSLNTISSSASKASTSFQALNNASSAVSSSISSLGSIGSSAMASLISSFKSAESSAKSVGKSIANSLTKSIENGLDELPNAATRSMDTFINTLSNARSRAYTAGSFIGQGLAQGLASQVGNVASQAAQLAAAADAAIRAKARIGSPSKVTDEDGGWIGIGFANGISKTAGIVQKAIDNLYAIPQNAGTDFAFSGIGATLSESYDYSNKAEYTIYVPVEINGKEVAKASATFTRDELNKKDKIDERLKGKR